MRIGTTVTATLVVAAMVTAMAPVSEASSRGPAHRPSTSGASTAEPPTGLRVAGQAHDALVGTARPSLTWTVNDSGRAEEQTGYEIRVAGFPSDRDPHGQPVWDSGRVESSDSTGVEYGGPDLVSDHTYEWSVRTWNREGRQSAWSKPERFDVGLLEVGDWQGSWLRAPDGALVRRDFTLQGTVVRARLYLGAQGLVEPHLNGTRVNPEQVLDSSVTDYAKRVTYREFDVTDSVRKGRNAVALMVGRGQHAGDPTFVAQLELTFADGGHASIATDDGWRSATGPITRDDFYQGESWDARREISGWDEASFDDSTWSPVAVDGAVAERESLALGKAVTALDETACCGWSRAALVDGIDRSSDESEGYHSAAESTADHTKWVQVDLGADQQIAGITLFPAHPTNDPAGDFPGAGFPVRYRVQVSDDPGFDTSTTVVDRTDADQPNPGATPVQVTTPVTGRYVRVTATKLECRGGTSCTFRLAELGVYAAQPAMTWGLTRLEADTTPPTRIVQLVAPVRTTTPADGVRVFDFGQNYAGQVALEATAPAGTKVTVTKGELLDGNGRVTTSNISMSASDTGRQIDDYTFDGSGSQSWMPHFNYAGFRYAEVRGLPAGADVSVVADVIHSDVAQTGSFDTSDPILNQIQDALLQTQLNNLQGLPLDCPTREKRGWLGDAGDTDAEALANFDMQSLYTKWLGDIRTSVNADGSVPSVAPAEGNAAYFTDPAWGTAFPQIVWDSYTHYGDPTVLRDNYAQVKNWVDYLATISDSNHIVVRAPGFWGDDWLSTVSTPHVYYQTLFYLIDSRLLANMADALGHTADATKYRELARNIATGFTDKYFDAGTDSYGTGTQLSYAMPLALDIVPAGHEQAVLDNLVADIVAHHHHVTTGFVGTTFVYQALGRYDRNDVALAIAQRTDYPSFGYMVANGPGTIWEKWNNSSAPDGTSSKDHIGLAGSIGRWYHEQLAGIQPGTDGFGTFTLAPSVVGDLTHVSATQHTVRGAITSSWRLDGATLTYKAQVPVGSTATVELPLVGGAGSTVRERGTVVWAGGHAAADDPGLAVHGVEHGALTMTAGSGHYVFTVKAPSTTVTNLAITSATTQAAIAPGRTGDVDVAVRSSSTGGGNAVLGAQAPEGWTVTAEPATIPLAAGPTHTLATLHLTPPADALGKYPIDLTVRAPDGTTTKATMTVDVYHRRTLYDFESGTQDWQAGANVDGVAAVSSMANGPGHPYEGNKSLEAADANTDASQWHTITVTPEQPLDLTAATHVVLAMDSWGGLPGATYRAQVVLHGGSTDRTLTTPITNDTWNQLDLDISGWAQRSRITSIDVSFGAVGSNAAWGGRFQIDDVAWTDEQP